MGILLSGRCGTETLSREDIRDVNYEHVIQGSTCPACAYGNFLQ